MNMYKMYQLPPYAFLEADVLLSYPNNIYVAIATSQIQSFVQNSFES